MIYFNLLVGLINLYLVFDYVQRGRTDWFIDKGVLKEGVINIFLGIFFTYNSLLYLYSSRREKIEE